ncbi:MAG: membrane protein insertion efficiency factor YidD [Deltaproteobacteria bacterium]|nr:membrane protein insertion efficiency factor YidD [Deltaproteobacteria bacterium]
MTIYLRKLCIAPIRLYQCCISPLLPHSCRFYPSCSAYAVEAIAVHGVFRGAFLALRRLLRCHPFCDGGIDPVPPAAGPRAPAPHQAGKQAGNR